MSSVQQGTSYHALYRACMKEAAAQGRTLMQRLVVRAGESMPCRAALAPDEHERKLLTEFAQAIAGDTRKAGALSFDSLELMGDEHSLELMGDEQMQESVELLRL